ncbi:MAG: RMD1 family protein, partial [Bdellovibrionales bacterium]|nr:RMD1 family protein [Bdellovibrionales bacterium]
LLEQDVEEVLNESSTLVNRIESPRWVGSRRKHLVAQLGSILRLRHDMVTRLLLLHTPDSTWDQEVCSKLHHSLHSDYEIDIRRQNIDRMLSLSSETINAELHLLDTRRSELLEIIIILLIAFEIVPVLLP